MENKIFRTMSLVIAVLLLLGLGITGREVHAQEPMLHIVNTTEDLRDFALNGVCSAGSANQGRCSLRAAIFEASYDIYEPVVIQVPPGVYKLTLTEPSFEGEPEDHYGDLDFPDLDDGEATDITIIGTGDWDNPSVIDANFIDRVMQIGANQKVHLENLVLKNGLPMMIDDDRRGGGLKIFNATVTLNHVRLTNNEALETSTYAANGGGIFSFNSRLSLLNCELDHNKADDGSALAGGFDYDTTVIRASTIHHNTVNFELRSHIIPGNNMLIINSTISDNQGGRYNIQTCEGKSITIQNSTIISRGKLAIINSQSGNLALLFNILQVIPTPGVESGKVCYLSEGNEPSHGGNIFSDDSCGPTAADAVISYSDMLLGPVANYGGWTPTIPLRPGSPAVNFGSGVCPGLYFGSQPLKKDQRGKDRDDGRCDSGSFELQSGEIPTVVYLPLIAK